MSTSRTTSRGWIQRRRQHGHQPRGRPPREDAPKVDLGLRRLLFIYALAVVYPLGSSADSCRRGLLKDDRTREHCRLQLAAGSFEILGPRLGSSASRRTIRGGKPSTREIVERPVDRTPGNSRIAPELQARRINKIANLHRPTNQEVACSNHAGRTNRFDQFFQQFLRERTYIHNVTSKTLSWYDTAWKPFNRSRSTSPSQPASAPLISRTDLQSFVVYLRERGVKPVSCNTWLRALNAFCRWLHEQGEIPSVVKLAATPLQHSFFLSGDGGEERIFWSAVAAMAAGPRIPSPLKRQLWPSVQPQRVRDVQRPASERVRSINHLRRLRRR